MERRVRTNESYGTALAARPLRLELGVKALIGRALFASREYGKDERDEGDEV
jgi:hypothetical protein